MPFTTADVEKHTKKATTDKLKNQWVKVANSWRSNCMERGGSEEKCDASAIKSANGVIARQVEEAAMWQGVEEIAKSAIEVGLALANGSGEITAERANQVLRKWEVELGGLSGVSVADSASFQINGHTVSLDELKVAYLELQEAKTKTVDGKPRPAGDFLVVEDSDKTSTWHLPVKVNGTPDHRLMGAAWAALHGGYRGQEYQGPDKAKAISKLKALYKSEDMETPPVQEAAMIDADKIRNLLTEALSMLEEGDAMEGVGQAVKVGDATEEHTANLSESEVASLETGRRAPVIVDFQILQPGPGNSRDNRYYPADVVERDIHVFEGVDVFATDHKAEERSERTKVGTVLACPSFFTESRAPVASVLLYDPNQAEKARNRADAGALATLECSILGNGRVKDGEVDGEKYKIVKEITNGRYLELVSKAGAGGKALNLAEVEPGGSDMTESQEVAPVEEVEEVEIEEADAGEQESKMLGGEVVSETLGKTNLPEFVKATLAEREYQSDSELQTAIDEATTEVKKLSGSGQVTGLGESEPAEPELSLEEREERRKKAFNEIMAEVGLRPI